MSTDKVAHNTYFDGKVQSLGIATDKGPATVGVMKQGTYVFNTSSPETMIVVAGILQAKLSGGDWISYKKDAAFDVPANSSFEVKCDADVAYICYYQ